MGAVNRRNQIEANLRLWNISKCPGSNGQNSNDRRKDRLRSRLVSRFQNARNVFKRWRERAAPTLDGQCLRLQSEKNYKPEWIRGTSALVARWETDCFPLYSGRWWRRPVNGGGHYDRHNRYRYS